MNGYETSIFEMHDLPGGVCTSWKRKGYTVDGCIHWLVGSNPAAQMHRIWEELGTGGLKYVNHDEYVRVEEDRGQTLIIHTDPDRLERHLKELSPEDGPVIDEFIGGIRAFARLDLPPGVPDGFIPKIKALGGMLPVLPLFAKWKKVPVADFARRFKNPFLRGAFHEALGGEMGLPMLAMLMTLAWLHTGNAGYPIGGSLEFARAMERRYLALGGRITYRARVRKILTENGRAVGVRLEDGSEHRADWVISAADGHATIFDLLEGKYLDGRIRGYYETLPLFPPIVFVGLGVNRTFPDLPHSVAGVSVPLPEPVTLGGAEVKRMGFTIYNFDPTLAPPGKTVVKTMFPVDYDWWKALAQEPARYQAEKERIAREVVNILDRRFPGVASQVEMVDVATPLTFERYTGNWRGSYEGWLITAKTFGMRLPKTLPGLDRFYMAGQWVEPGGGLPPAAMSGRDVVREICRRDGRKFATSRA